MSWVAEELDLAVRSVTQWAIRSVGRRPTDYMLRDMLIAPLLRDKRQWQYKQLTTQRPDWLLAGMARVSPEHRLAAMQIRALHYLHADSLYRLMGEASPDQQRTIAGVLGCLPIGMEVEWSGPEHYSPRNICNRARLCPFCFARRVRKLYRDLQQTILSGCAEPVLLVARVTVPGDIIPSALRAAPLRERCRAVRREVTQRLIYGMKGFGARGGLSTLVLGPRQFDAWQGGQMVRNALSDFDFTVTILGHVTRCTHDLWQLLDDQKDGQFDFHAFDEPLGVSFRLLGGRSALRLGLFGSAVTFRRSSDLSNVVGAFSWPGWNLANYAQWAEHFTATRGLQLFEMFGEWTAAGSDAAEEVRLAENPDDGVGALRDRPHQGGQHNAIEAERARGRRTALLAVLLRLASEQAYLRRRGYVEISRALARAGRHISVRDAKWLAKELKNHVW